MLSRAPFKVQLFSTPSTLPIARMFVKQTIESSQTYFWSSGTLQSCFTNPPLFQNYKKEGLLLPSIHQIKIMQRLNKGQAVMAGGER